MKPFYTKELAHSQERYGDNTMAGIISVEHINPFLLSAQQILSQVCNIKTKVGQISKDNMCIDGGDYTLRLLHTPGHSPDASSFLIEEEGVVFTGDSFQGSGAEFSSLILIQNPTLYYASIEKMQKLANDGVYHKMYLGHEFVDQNKKLCSELNGKDEIIPFLEYCKQTAMNYVQFCREHRDMTIDECTDAIDDLYGYTKTPLMPFLRPIAIAHIKALLDKGNL
jgi:glyoxylase-like metal-dependent hydrolase (beta-lactamase superfamily II)